MKKLVAKKQHEDLVNQMKDGNPALVRLANTLKSKEDNQEVINYSRMHHRHNRS